uniref:EGF-like domain-containing protein n=1 Tax=Tetraodon nigroviridis TaxID=99883 RepID=H3BX58_TETNG
CNSGSDGDGQCLCQPPYSGPRCDQVSSKCSHCSSYSHCNGDGEATSCECLPGYRKTAEGTCTGVCSAGDCDANGQCSSEGAKISCSCKQGYEGNGKVCIPINPCSKDNGGCPSNSTYCVLKGPDKSSCECMLGLSPIGGSAESGCQLVSACGEDTCHSTAVCRTGLDGRARCDCT